MAALLIHKVTTVPTTWVADSIYIVKNGDGKAEFYVTDAGGVPAAAYNKAEVAAMIANAVAGMGQFQHVATIAARDALVLNTNCFVLVDNAASSATAKDASGNAVTSSGAASFFYDSATGKYTKLSEYESMDMVLNWASVQGKPNSTPAAIDTAVGQTHSHANKAILDALGSNVDGLTYNGQNIGTVWATKAW